MSVGKPLKFKTPKSLQKKISDYFKFCDEKNRPYTITGLALFLDTSRQTLLEYEGEVEGRDGRDPLYADAIRRAKLRCQAFAEESLWTPKVATGVIFNLKNNYGWRDQKDFEISDKRLIVNDEDPER